MIRTLSLIKESERFTINYETGSEVKTIDHLITMASNPDLNFDWFDAAELSNQIGHNLKESIIKPAKS